MYLKALFVVCLVAFASCQPTESSCAYDSFTFYQSYEAGSYFPEQFWDWYGNSFSDGTDDTFDDYFLLQITIDDVVYDISNFYSIPVDFQCDIGTTDASSASYASYLYNLTDTVQLQRFFYAPRAGKQMGAITKVNLVIDVVQLLGFELSRHSSTMAPIS